MYRRLLLSLSTASFFCVVYSRLIISPFVPDIIVSLGSSKSSIGLALTGMWVAFAVIQFPSGIVTDRTGARPVVLVALAATGVGSFLLSQSGSLAVFALSAILLGGGAGAYYPAAASLLSRKFQTGTAVGFLLVGAPLAGLLAPAAATYIGEHHTWHLGMITGAGLTLVALGLSVVVIPEDAPDRTGSSLRSTGGLFVDVVRSPSVLFMVLVAGLGMFTMQAIYSFFPTFLVEHRDLDASLANTSFAAIFLLSAFALPAGGRISDMAGRDVALGVALLVKATGLLLLANAASMLAVPIALIGIGMSWDSIVQSRIMNAFPQEERSRMFGLIRTLYLLIGSLGSAVVGLLAEEVGWHVSFTLLGTLLLLGMLAVAVNHALDLGL